MPVKLRRRPGYRRPEFTVTEILTWADAHHRRTGKWPEIHSGPIRDGPAGEKWRRVDTALRLGLRGLPGGSSLAQLLAEHRNVRHHGQLPPLRPRQIVAWADAHRERTGKWPTSLSGPVPEAPGETWRAVDQALRVGVRGLPGGSSLARLLLQERGVRNLQRLPPLTARQILAWADAHHERTGAWPNSGSGPVADAPGETWAGVASALLRGRRGLPGGTTLARFLAQHRGVRNAKGLPRLSLGQIRDWARAHRRRTGQWPTPVSGPIAEAPGESWSAVNAALKIGCRGLPAGLSLAKVIAAGRPEPAESPRSRLTVAQILAWADAHCTRHGCYPHSRSGPIPEAPGETWRGVDQALHKNQRGLTVGLTLVQLLTRERGLRNRQYPPCLSERKILAWAEAHRRRTGEWPNFRSGAIPEVPGETWRAVDESLRQGLRGLPGGISLARLLALRKGARNRTSLPPLTPKQILAWAKAHHERTGNWPTNESGPIHDAPGETWKGVDMALRGGYRGLPGGLTLAKLLAEKRGVRNRTNLPVLTTKLVLAWAEAHYRRKGSWPTSQSGPVAEAPGETWHSIDLGLRWGYRGLPGGMSLAQLLNKHRPVAARVDGRG